MATAAAGDIAAASGLRVLVLDDFHLAAGSQVEAGVAAGRAAAAGTAPGDRHPLGPEAPLHRWRLRGELCELRAGDLRFRDDEVDRLFAGRHGLVLGTEDRARLLHHTEGWAAGLQLAALSLRHGSDVPELLERFASTHQPLLDFLASEVLDRQPPWRRRFLQAAACVGEFCPAVLDAVLDRADSSEVLRGVRADNLFLVPLDTGPGGSGSTTCSASSCGSTCMPSTRTASAGCGAAPGCGCAPAATPPWRSTTWSRRVSWTPRSAWSSRA